MLRVTMYNVSECFSTNKGSLGNHQLLSIMTMMMTTNIKTTSEQRNIELS